MSLSGLTVSPTVKAFALAALFAAGFLIAGTVGVVAVGADTTTTATATTTAVETTTAPGTTVVTTATVPQTTATVPQTTATVPTTPIATTSQQGSSTPTWVWVVLGVLAAAVVGLIVALLMRRPGAIPDEDRRRRLEGAIATWTAQGWALESETSDSAVLRRGGEQMMISIDAAGHVSTRPLAGD